MKLQNLVLFFCLCIGFSFVQAKPSSSSINEDFSSEIEMIISKNWDDAWSDPPDLLVGRQELLTSRMLGLAEMVPDKVWTKERREWFLYSVDYLFTGRNASFLTMPSPKGINILFDDLEEKFQRSVEILQETDISREDALRLEASYREDVEIIEDMILEYLYGKEKVWIDTKTIPLEEFEDFASINLHLLRESTSELPEQQLENYKREIISSGAAIYCQYELEAAKLYNLDSILGALNSIFTGPLVVNGYRSDSAELSQVYREMLETAGRQPVLVLEAPNLWFPSAFNRLSEYKTGLEKGRLLSGSFLPGRDYILIESPRETKAFSRLSFSPETR